MKCMKLNERSSADSCVSQRVKAKTEIKQFVKQFIIYDQSATDYQTITISPPALSVVSRKLIRHLTGRWKWWCWWWEAADTSWPGKRTAEAFHWQLDRIWMPPKIFEGGIPKNIWQGDQLEHTNKPYTGGQLTGYIPVNMRWRTTHARNYGSRDRQLANLILARL